MCVMKNFILITIAATLFLFTSCSKETFELPQTAEFPSTEMSSSELSAPNSNSISAMEQGEVISLVDVTIRIQVTGNSSSEIAGEYLVDFSGNYDFTGAELKEFQTLAFTDGNGNPSSLTFDVNSTVGTNGSLSVVFSMGGNDLTGLTLGAAQEIIIEDFVIN